MRIKNLFSVLHHKAIGEYKWGLKHGLRAGKGVNFMGGVSLGSEPYLIQLGNNVRVSGEVSFVTHDGGTWAFRREVADETLIRFGKIVVGDDTFIGTRSIIMPGVTIGKSCVIGAGSIVTRDVPDRTVVAGSPARVICTLDEYIEKCRNKKPENFDYEAYKKNKQEYLVSFFFDD